MTDDQIAKIKALRRCRFLPGSNDKRFVLGMADRADKSPEFEMSEKQSAYLDRLMHKYRRQIREPTKHMNLPQ